MENQSDQIKLGILFQIALRLWPEDAGDFFVPDYANALDPFDEDYEKQKSILHRKNRSVLRYRLAYFAALRT